EWKPHIAFNLLEGFDDITIFDQNVVSHLELLKLSYTGCNPRGLLMARDKSLSKKLLAYHRIPVPEFEVFRIGRPIRRPKRLTFPLIVKSLTQEASIGIRSEEHTSELQSRGHLVCRLLLEKKKKNKGGVVYVGSVSEEEALVYY